MCVITSSGPLDVLRAYAYEFGQAREWVSVNCVAFKNTRWSMLEECILRERNVFYVYTFRMHSKTRSGIRLTPRGVHVTYICLYAYIHANTYTGEIRI